MPDNISYSFFITTYGKPPQLGPHLSVKMQIVPNLTAAALAVNAKASRSLAASLKERNTQRSDTAARFLACSSFF